MPERTHDRHADHGPAALPELATQAELGSLSADWERIRRGEPE
ncbi:hypothetical protein ACWDT6_22405 [Nocardia grenadensis]